MDSSDSGASLNSDLDTVKPNSLGYVSAADGNLSEGTDDGAESLPTDSPTPPKTLPQLIQELYSLIAPKNGINWTEVREVLKNIGKNHLADDNLRDMFFDLDPLGMVGAILTASTPAKEAECIAKLKLFANKVLKFIDNGPSTSSRYSRKKRENIPLIKILFRKKMFK